MYKTIGLVVLALVLAAAVALVTGVPSKSMSPESQESSGGLITAFAAEGFVSSEDPLAIPAERPGWVQYETYAKSSTRPHLRILGVKIVRDLNHDNNIGLTIAIKNIGAVPCKRCWLLLSTQMPGREEPTPRSWILVVSSSEPLKPGEVRRGHWWVDESSNEQVKAWLLEFYSYVGPYDP
jgi:hypothetical protein